MKQFRSVMKQLNAKICFPGDEVLAVSTVGPENRKQLDDLTTACHASHEKYIQILKQVAETSGLDLTVKTVLLIKPKTKTGGQ